MKNVIPTLLTVGSCLVSGSGLAAAAPDSPQRTYAPDYCSDRTANCVVDDGPPPRTPWVHPKTQSANTGITGTGGSGSGAGTGTGAGAGSGSSSGSPGSSGGPAGALRGR